MIFYEKLNDEIAFNLDNESENTKEAMDREWIDGKCGSPDDEQINDENTTEVMVIENNQTNQDDNMILDSSNGDETDLDESEGSNEQVETSTSENTLDGTMVTVGDDSLSFVDDPNDPDYSPGQPMGVVTPTQVKTRSNTNQVNTFRLNFAFLIPISVSEARESVNAAKWNEAMMDEMNAHRLNNTWTLVGLPVNRKAIKAKWVFATKKNERGEIVRHKARLVAKGCGQRY